jgi:hypothetical protein
LPELEKIKCEKREKIIRKLKQLAKKNSNMAFQFYKSSLQGWVRNGRFAHWLV